MSPSMSARETGRRFDVVVPLDGSATAASALGVGFWIAQRSNGAVTVVHSAEPSTSHAAAERSDLDASLERFAEVAPYRIEISNRPPADAILAAAANGRALVCMSSNGRGGLARLALGSVAEEVVRRSPVPLVVTGPAGAAAMPLAAEQARMMYCTDGSELSTRAVGFAARFADATDMAVTVAQTIRPDEEVGSGDRPPPQPLRAEAIAHCGVIRDFFEAEGVASDAEVLFGDPVRAIPERAKSLPAALVTAVTHGRDGVLRYLVGSTVMALIRRSPCPMLVVGPAYDPEAAASIGGESARRS